MSNHGNCTSSEGHAHPWRTSLYTTVYAVLPKGLHLHIASGIFLSSDFVKETTGQVIRPLIHNQA
ncbi:hypothetical protein [Paenibacillus illinoisensis]|uniref:hypothetical protein n=1 Tax=Paenibacillus illinoisensis TaxID=59845 RepID=UPI0015E8BE40|nr:hypothetical protein [Paenibacillus illinoisensis]